MSGGPGDDYLVGNDGTDYLHGGPGLDILWADIFYTRDFSFDFVDCGSDSDIAVINSADDNAKINCETIKDSDG